jgi:hypothetical protein
MPTVPRPDDPCPCSSGLRYGDCHQKVNAAPPSQALNVGRREYADRWKANAAAYEAQGVYSELADHLASFGNLSRVIDIGCGRGEGLVALREKTVGSGSLLIGLDENPDCLKAAAERLGVDCPRKRLRRVSQVGREYDLEIVAGRLPRLSSISLVQTDLLRPDLELEALLSSAAPYDAVTLWFTGIHPAREYDRICRDLKITTNSLHRMVTDIAALRCAGEFVRPGGYFHVVTRGVTNHPPSLQANLEGEMAALAEHGPVELVEVILLPYQEPTSNVRIGVAGTDLAPNDAETFAVSAIFRIVLPS